MNQGGEGGCTRDSTTITSLSRSLSLSLSLSLFLSLSFARALSLSRSLAVALSLSLSLSSPLSFSLWAHVVDRCARYLSCMEIENNAHALLRNQRTPSSSGAVIHHRHAGAGAPIRGTRGRPWPRRCRVHSRLLQVGSCQSERCRGAVASRSDDKQSAVHRRRQRER